jgi:hypothetical protein
LSLALSLKTQRPACLIMRPALNMISCITVLVRLRLAACRWGASLPISAASDIAPQAPSRRWR